MEALEIALVIAFTMAFVEVIKRLLKKWLSDETIAVILLFLPPIIGGLLNMGNVAFFTDAPATTAMLKEAFRVGLVAGAGAAGLYSGGKNIAEKFVSLKQ